MKSIKFKLLILIFAAVLPALGILVYSNYERQRHDLAVAKADVLGILQGLANGHENDIEATRRFLMTLARLPAVQDRNAAACARLFRELLKENTQYTAIFAADREGLVFASALPAGRISIGKRRYFQETLRTKTFSVGEYVLGSVSRRAVLPFAYPVMDSDGRVTGVVGIAIDLEKYGRNFVAMTQFPKSSTLNLLDSKFVRLYHYPDNEKYVGKADLPEIVKQLSAGPREGVFTSIGVDGVKRLFAYKGFFLKGGSSPYLFMRIGIPQQLAVARAKSTFLLNIGLLLGSLMAALLVAWILGDLLVVKRLGRLVNASKRLGQGDLSARTGLSQTGDELGELAQSFDDMARALQAKELERRQAQAELIESEIKFKSFAEQAFVGTYLLQDGILKYVNPKYAEMFGYTVEECLSEDMSLDRLVAIDDLEKVREQIRRRISGEADFVHYTFRGVRKSGQVFLAEVYGSVSVHEGRPAAAGTILDITERRQAEEALRESEEKFRLMVENSHDIIYMLNADGVFTFVSTTWTTLLGHPVDKVVGKSFQSFIHPDDLPGCAAFLRSVIGTGQRQEGIEYRVQHSDGTWYWHSSSAVPFKDEEGNSVGFYGIARDITLQKKAKEELETLVSSLQRAIEEIKTLKGIVPICANCKKIRDDKGYWEQVDAYVSRHTEAQFSHGICPDCVGKLYPKFAADKKTDPEK
ncbi:MAG: PAS domain S-box protein [Deltaproteobacteria bacterium]